MANTISFESAPSPAKKCPTCGRHEATPYRREVRGEIVEGCIDGFHSDAMLHADTPSAGWHWRPEAIRHRADVAAYEKALFGGRS